MWANWWMHCGAGLGVDPLFRLQVLLCLPSQSPAAVNDTAQNANARLSPNLFHNIIHVITSQHWFFTQIAHLRLEWWHIDEGKTYTHTHTHTKLEINLCTDERHGKPCSLSRTLFDQSLVTMVAPIIPVFLDLLRARMPSASNYSHPPPRTQEPGRLGRYRATVCLQKPCFVGVGVNDNFIQHTSHTLTGEGSRTVVCNSRRTTQSGRIKEKRPEATQGVDGINVTTSMWCFKNRHLSQCVCVSVCVCVMRISDRS